MKNRWILFFDGACPLCTKYKTTISQLSSNNIKLTTVDLNSHVAKSKGYSNNKLVLETTDNVYYGFDACIKLLSQTKYNWSTHWVFRPVVFVGYLFISTNRKLISKLL